MIRRKTAFTLAHTIVRMDYRLGMHWFNVAARPWWQRIFPSTYAYHDNTKETIGIEQTPS